MRRRRWKKFSALTTLLILGAMLRLVFVFSLEVSPGKGLIAPYPAEVKHLEIVQHISQNGGLPIYHAAQHDSSIQIRQVVAQSPLYYYLAIIPYKIFNFFHKGWGVYGVRLLSVVFGLMCAWVAYSAAMILSRKKEIALGTLTAFLFAPNSLIISSVTTNDSLLMLVSAVFFLNLIYCRTHNGGVIRQIFTGLTLGLMAWVNLSAIFLVPLVWFAADPMNERRERWLARGRTLGSMFLVVLPLIIWVFAENDYCLSLKSIVLQDYAAVNGVFQVDRSLLGIIFSLLSGFFSTVVHLLAMDHTGFLEIAVCSIWFVFWVIISGIGAHVSNSDVRSRGLLTSGIILTALGFLLTGIVVSEVNFALFTLVFFPLAYLAALGSERVYLSVWHQVFAWLLPIILMPLF